MLFGQFVGSWDLEWTGTGANGERATAVGELHVGWVLGGRAVQDIWIVPGHGQPGVGQPPSAFHGSTIRFYDPSAGAWRSTWVEPVTCRVRRFVGPLAVTSCWSATRKIPSYTGASPTSGPTHSPGWAWLHTTAAAPGSSRSRCTPPAAAAAEQPGAAGSCRSLVPHGGNLLVAAQDSPQVRARRVALRWLADQAPGSTEMLRLMDTTRTRTCEDSGCLRSVLACTGSLRPRHCSRRTGQSRDRPRPRATARTACPRTPTRTGGWPSIACKIW